MNYVDYEANRKAIESANKDTQKYIREHICTGEPAQEREVMAD